VRGEEPTTKDDDGERGEGQVVQENESVLVEICRVETEKMIIHQQIP
jgi:hypothetical protein